MKIDVRNALGQDARNAMIKQTNAKNVMIAIHSELTVNVSQLAKMDLLKQRSQMTAQNINHVRNAHQIAQNVLMILRLVLNVLLENN